MPLWGQIVLGAGAVISALGIIWAKVVKPFLRFMHRAEEMLPLLTEMTIVFRDSPHAFKVLDDIVNQFKTDSGSSLRDVVNRLEKAAQDNHQAGEVLKVQVEVAKELAAQDRTQLANLVLLLQTVLARTETQGKLLQAVTAEQGIVAGNLAEKEAHNAP